MVVCEDTNNGKRDASHASLFNEGDTCGVSLQNLNIYSYILLHKVHLHTSNLFYTPGGFLFILYNDAVGAIAGG
ncbi:hypothetical protein M2273_001496 [Mucilaginibacter lappiensis]